MSNTNNWTIDADKIEPKEVSPRISGVDALDGRIEQLYQKANLPFYIKVILDYAKHLFVKRVEQSIGKFNPPTLNTPSFCYLMNLYACGMQLQNWN